MFESNQPFHPERNSDSFPIVRLSDDTLRDLQQVCSGEFGTFLPIGTPNFDGDPDWTLQENVFHINERPQTRQDLQLWVYRDGVVKWIMQKIDGERFSCDYAYDVEDGKLYNTEKSVGFLWRSPSEIPQRLRFEDISSIQGNIRSEIRGDSALLIIKFKDGFELMWNAGILQDREILYAEYKTPHRSLFQDFDSSVPPELRTEQDEKDEEEARRKLSDFLFEFVVEDGKPVMKITVNDWVISITVGNPEARRIEGLVSTLRAIHSSADDQKFAAVQPVPLVPLLITERQAR